MALSHIVIIMKCLYWVKLKLVDFIHILEIPVFGHHAV